MGIATAEAIKKEVPLQKASIAPPFSETVTIGSAILRDVASMAEASVTTHIDANAKMKLLDGLKMVFSCSDTVRLVCEMCGSAFWVAGSSCCVALARSEMDVEAEVVCEATILLEMYFRH